MQGNGISNGPDDASVVQDVLGYFMERLIRLQRIQFQLKIRVKATQSRIVPHQTVSFAPHVGAALPFCRSISLGKSKAASPVTTHLALFRLSPDEAGDLDRIQIQFLFLLFRPFGLGCPEASGDHSQCERLVFGRGTRNLRRCFRRFLGRRRKSRRREAAGRGNSPEAAPKHRGQEKGKLICGEKRNEFRRATPKHCDAWPQSLAISFAIAGLLSEASRLISSMYLGSAPLSRRPLIICST
jgi:hypothetical protein